MAVSRIVQLAQIIASSTSLIDDHLRANSLPQPSFEINGPVEPIQKSDEKIENARTDVVAATIELRQLLEGPTKLLLPEVITLSYRIEYRGVVLIHVAKLFSSCSNIPV